MPPAAAARAAIISRIHCDSSSGSALPIVPFAVWLRGSRRWLHMPEFEALIAARKCCRICVERSPGKIRSCAEFDFDPNVVSHWEPWLGHKRPKLLAVGQDFGNLGYFVRNRGRDDPGNKT